MGTNCFVFRFISGLHKFGLQNKEGFCPFKEALHLVVNGKDALQSLRLIQ